ncbi:hypothetical protein [Weissella soli]|uniref:Uncharacterized protein n=1 Tax=Weissella soli TaxID=155866 RepID=A0A288Q8B9_9LACO|nr:hypothetical protein [Weissella soli]AOT56254.1 hypothetical protein WSWS_00617 [Weissella soli]NKY82713.1 hypothetical protein [Weissella soli]RDL11828.1 hypothetical protein DFP99_0247 [Weissella soli]GEN92944.1 cell surface protein [Weissella soli]
MKKIINVTITLVTALTLLAPVSVFADDLTGSTATDVTFTAGSLSLTGVTTSATFDATTDALSAGTIYTGGLDATSTTKLGAKVTDLTASTSGWTLTLAKSAWTAGTGGTTAGVTVLDNNAKILVNSKELTTAGTTIQTGDGNTVETTMADLPLEITLPTGTAIKAGSYTNTLNWSLAAGVSTTQN